MYIWWRVSNAVAFVQLEPCYATRVEEVGDLIESRRVRLFLIKRIIACANTIL